MMKQIVTLITLMISIIGMASAQNESVVTQTADPFQVNISTDYRPRFSWGLDAGSAIDMTGNDMSAVDINAYLGYSCPYIRLVGIGAGIDMMVSSSSTTYPVYTIFRTDFHPTPQLYFLEARGGVAFSNIESYDMQETPFGSIGFGITLATGHSFSSHIILSYNYVKLNDIYTAGEHELIRMHDLQYASLRIGISF